MLKYWSEKYGEWFALDLMQLKEICAVGVDFMVLYMKDGKKIMTTKIKTL